MEEQKKEKKRFRRTKNALEQDLVNAVEDLIEEVGFTNVTISGIIQKARIEPGVFYNRYKSLDDLFDKFVRKYDYWIQDAVDYDPENLTPKENSDKFCSSLIDSLDSDRGMQRLLAWELNEKNKITKRTATNRERNSAEMLEYFKEYYKDSDVDFEILSSILIGGIFYLIMHRNIAPFCSVDFKKKENIGLLKKNIQLILDRVLDTPEEK